MTPPKKNNLVELRDKLLLISVRNIIDKYLSKRLIYLFLFVSLILLISTNIWLFIICIGNLTQPIRYIPYFVLLVVVIAGSGGLTAWMFLSEKEISENEDGSLDQSRRKVPEGYHDIFSQSIDPIGNLYLWRVVAEKRSRYLKYGPEIVEELESYLERHCNITRIGSFGDIVLFDQSLFFYLQDDKKNKKSQNIPVNGTPVKIIEPGWIFGDSQILRQPRVR